MKKLPHISIFLFTLLSLITAEIIEKVPVGPGVTYYHDIQEDGPWNIYILEADLSNPWIRLETIKAGNQVHALEQTSVMTMPHDREAHRVVGAVNADFFTAQGNSLNSQVIDGVLLKTPDRSWPAFAVTDMNRLLTDTFTYSGYLYGDSDSIYIDNVNKTADTTVLAVYNKYFPGSTETNEDFYEVIAENISQPLVNDNVRAKILAVGTCNSAIPDNGVVFSGKENIAEYLQQFEVGDTIQYVLNLKAADGKIKEYIGGYPKLISQGKPAEMREYHFVTNQHPRTAIGFSKDQKKFYMMVVDGRQPGYSVGMDLYELTDYMLEWNIWEAMNFDGGGSSVMVARNSVKSSPSDAAGERYVTNALTLVSTAPTGDFANLRIEAQKVHLLTKTGKQFSLKAFDQYYNPVHLPQQIKWSCSRRLGKFTNRGVFKAKSKAASGYVYARSGDVIDSALVYVTPVSQVVLATDSIKIENGKTMSLNALAFGPDGHILDGSIDDYNWSVEPELGTVSKEGVFFSERVGNGMIVADLRGVKDTIFVTVGQALTVVIDDFDNTDNWTLTYQYADTVNSEFVSEKGIFATVPASGLLRYYMEKGGTTVFALNREIPVIGQPHSLGIKVYGDGKGHWLRGEFIDKDGESFIINLTESNPGINWHNEWKYLEIELDTAKPGWANPNATLDFPITWKRIYMAETNDDKKGWGLVYFDEMTMRYISIGDMEK